MYGKKFVQKENILILNNSVDVDKFDFNVSIRKKMRKSYGLENSDFALLHVGRFVEQKNHLYLIKVFKELLETSENENYKLFLIGDGKLKNEIVHLISELHLENNVILLGLQNNVSDFMQMADCFVMTSIHEGLPIVAVEAQASGMPCILSSNISIETNIVGDGIDFVSIGEDNKNEWVKKNNKQNIQKYY